MTGGKRRIAVLDAIRAMAITLVLMGHSVEQTFHFAENDVLAVQGPVKGMVVLSLFTLARISVPLFLFLTGYFFLPRTYGEKEAKGFWKHNFGRLLLVTELWIIVYNIFNAFFWNIPFSVPSVLRQMVFYENVPAMDHYWYLPTILGIYLFLPIVANGIKHLPAKSLLLPVGVLLLAFTVAPAFGSTEVSILEYGFTGGYFGAYVLLGYLVQQKVFRKIPGSLLTVAAVLLFFLVQTEEWFAHKGGSQNIVWYSWSTLLLLSLCIFELWTRRAKEPAVPDGKNRSLYFLSKYSFAVYLIHFPLVQAAVRISFWYTDSAFLTFLVAFFSSFLLSFLLAFLLDRIPKVGRYFLYMR